MSHVPSPPWSGRAKTLVLVAAAIFGVGVLWFISDAFSRLIVAGLVAFVASYPIRGLERRGMGRGLAVALSYVGVLVVSVLLAVFGIPALVSSIGQIDWAEIVESTAEWLVDTLESLRFVVLFGSTYDFSAVIDPILEFLADAEPEEIIEVDLERVMDWLSTGAGVLVGLASLLVGFLVEFFTVLVIALYFSIFLPATRAALPDLAPPAHRADVDTLLDRMWLVLDQYASGMVRVGLFIGAFTGLGLWLIGIPGAFFLGAIAGLLNVIPTLGPILAGVPGTLVALVQGSTRFDMNRILLALIVIAWYFVVQQVETQVATPRIMGGAVKMSALAVLLGVLVGLQVAGILGALVAVPLILTTREVFRYVHAKLLDEDPYPNRGLDTPDEPADLPAEPA